MRLAALDVLYEALDGSADVQAACYDAIVGDRLSVDRLRGIPEPMRPTNQRNELEGEVVEAMMRAIEENYPLGRRWFVRKAEVLGLDKLQLADQYAPVGSDRRVEWTEAVAMVDDSLRDFSPRLGDIFLTLSRPRRTSTPSRAPARSAARTAARSRRPSSRTSS